MSINSGDAVSAGRVVDSLYLAHELAETRVLGPGLRYVIWVQGCLRQCVGCVFPEGRSRTENGYWQSIGELEDKILANPRLRGITISGGEPFLQPRGLRLLIEGLKSHSSLDIMLYSGYRLEDLHLWGNADVEAILAASDLLVDGEYMEELNTNSLYRGSDNQRIHFLSDRYLPWKDRILRTKNRDMEFVQTNGGLFVAGLPPKNFRKNFLSAVMEYKKS